MKRFMSIEIGRAIKVNTFTKNFCLLHALLVYFLVSIFFNPTVMAQIDQDEITDTTFQYDQYNQVNSINPLGDNPQDIASELPASIPQDGSLIPQLKPQGWANLKRKLFKEYGLGIAINYSGVYQNASKTVTGNNTLAAGWLLVALKWEAYNRGEDFQGSFVVTFDWRHTFGDARNAAEYIYDLGSLYGTEAAYFAWDPYFTNFYW